jgi:sialidase-1
VDGGPWRERELSTPWSGGLHLPWVHVLEAELDRAKHVLDLRVAPGRHERSWGHAARIAHSVVNP